MSTDKIMILYKLCKVLCNRDTVKNISDCLYQHGSIASYASVAIARAEMSIRVSHCSIVSKGTKLAS